MITEVVGKNWQKLVNAASPHSHNNFCIFLIDFREFSIAVKSSGDKRSLSCKILLSGQILSKTSCFTLIKIILFTLAICISSPCILRTFFSSNYYGEPQFADSRNRLKRKVFKIRVNSIYLMLHPPCARRTFISCTWRFHKYSLPS